MKWPGRLLLTNSNALGFAVVMLLSGVISFLLTGKQIYQANWGLIDDHEIFNFLGPDLHLPFSEIWHTLLTKTELVQQGGRFRPGYYVFKLTETALWGTNVHLWYLARTVCFAIFLSSIWWFMRRFAGLWLSGALTVYVSLLPLWADVWSRLGPSEIYGTALVGVMIFASYFILFSGAACARNANAIVLTLATLALTIMKETFLPLAGSTVAVLAFAGFRKNLSVLLISVLTLALTFCVLGMAYLIKSQLVSAGLDFYAQPVTTSAIAGYGLRGMASAIGRVWWLYLIAGACLAILLRRFPGHAEAWKPGIIITIGVCGFLVIMYALQGAIYRGRFPTHSRYDFPAMLLAPLTISVLVCSTFYFLRSVVAPRAVSRTQIGMAALAFVFLTFAPSRIERGRSMALDKGKSLAAAIEANIQTTNNFYNELQQAVQAAKQSTESPIVLEAYGSSAYEAVFSLSVYLDALGARNRVSVRLHRDNRSSDQFGDELQRRLFKIEKEGRAAFVPLADNLTGGGQSCISIGINGVPHAGCAGFSIRTP
jgi:hypothetical protein